MSLRVLHRTFGVDEVQRQLDRISLGTAPIALDEVPDLKDPG